MGDSMGDYHRVVLDFQHVACFLLLIFNLRQ